MVLVVGAADGEMVVVAKRDDEDPSLPSLALLIPLLRGLLLVVRIM